ncbi:hypothetical protein ACH5RR_018753 [Cinchona calisaya]|uniref:Uncharacterized protein n=1 Tax=Cinchona calisaya TaxID=153742 RepID=A0ABD2ZMC7_9GENT
MHHVMGIAFHSQCLSLYFVCMQLASPSFYEFTHNQVLELSEKLVYGFELITQSTDINVKNGLISHVLLHNGSADLLALHIWYSSTNPDGVRFHPSAIRCRRNAQVFLINEHNDGSVLVCYLTISKI